MTDVPSDLPEIPAMTTRAERACYYRLAREASGQGAIVELGCWLGASTAYIAAGIRDAGVKARAQVYDRFKWHPQHEAKGATSKDLYRDFQANLGPLLDFVDVHRGEIADLKWSGAPVSLIVFDAPKRIREISATLIKFAGAVRPGTIMAWQDFAYFPSYDIPAALITLGHKIKFVEGVYPGTTAVFRVVEPWSTKQVSPAALELQSWSADRIEGEWGLWAERIPEPARPRFLCGAALFLCDNGHQVRAVKRLAGIVAAYPDDVLPKWRYLKEQRPHWLQRYAPLFDAIKGKL